MFPRTARFGGIRLITNIRRKLQGDIIGISPQRTYIKHKRQKKKHRSAQSYDHTNTTSVAVEHMLNLSKTEKLSNTQLREEEEETVLDEMRSDLESSLHNVAPDSHILNQLRSEDFVPETSDVPCPGCGAALQCENPAIPGYIVPSKYHSVPANRLKYSSISCQRCVLINTHNVALDLSVPAEKYSDIVSTIKGMRGLVVVVVDVLDMPNSLYKALPNLLGSKRPVYVVGNKVDMLPADGEDYLDRVQFMLEKACVDCGLADKSYIKHIALVSAKTGYGIEKFVSKLMEHWGRKGHVFLVGCTNAGKSTLFNALLSSDYCKSIARDFYHRATVSQWPGTTMSLLKFPIVDPSPWRLRERRLRLKSLPVLDLPDIVENYRMGKYHKAVLSESVGQTFLSASQNVVDKKMDSARLSLMSPSYSFSEKTEDWEEAPSKKDLTQTIKTEARRSGTVKEYHARWCYDTPGVINPNQVINKLDQYELGKLLPKVMIKPRTFVMKPGQVMFTSGLGRVDYIKGASSIYMTVFMSQKIPVFVVDSLTADVFYREHVGTQKLAVPFGDRERLYSLPSLIGSEFSLQGVGWMCSAADIVLSSLGWVAVTAGTGMEVSFRAYTPGGAGCTLRTPSVLCYAVNLRGRRIQGSASYRQTLKAPRKR